MLSNEQDLEALRQGLLDELYAGAFAGMPAMLAEEDAIRRADPEELLQIADQHGLI